MGFGLNWFLKVTAYAIVLVRLASYDSTRQGNVDDCHFLIKRIKEIKWHAKYCLYLRGYKCHNKFRTLQAVSAHNSYLKKKKKKI